MLACQNFDQHNLNCFLNLQKKWNLHMYVSSSLTCLRVWEYSYSLPLQDPCLSRDRKCYFIDDNALFVTEYMYRSHGRDAFFFLSCGELHLPQHLLFGISVKILHLLALTPFSLSKTEFEPRSEIPTTAKYIQLLSALAVLSAAEHLSCLEIPKQSLLK